MAQKDVFLAGEATAWLQRNRAKLGETDPVSEMIEQAAIVPSAVLEIGCADGWRLKKLQKQYGCRIGGVDPFMASTADSLPFPDDDFDLVIFGFCLYLVDRKDLFMVVAEADRVLKDKGYLIIHDFAANESYCKPYAHAEGVLSYHQYYPQLWLGNPAYSYCRENYTVDQHVTVLKKDMHRGWPVLNTP